MVEQWDLLTAEERACRLAERKVAAAAAQRGVSKVEELEFARAEWKDQAMVAEKVW